MKLHPSYYCHEILKKKYLMGKRNVRTQVDQKWPLVCHFLALVSPEYRSVEEYDTYFALFPGLFTLHVQPQHFLTLHYVGVS